MEFQSGVIVLLDNLIFSLNATVPVFLVMVLGFFLRRISVIDEEFARKLNKFDFLIPLPVLMFYQLATTDFSTAWNGKFVLFCFAATLISIGIVVLLSRFLKDVSLKGEFIQASYRSSAAILGIAYIQNIYGNAGMAPLMILACVPLYNVIAVVTLCMTAPQETEDLNLKVRLKTSMKNILRNPILIGIVAGLLYSVLGLPMPAIADKTLSSISSLATPLGLVALGASIRVDKSIGAIKPAAAAVFIKLAGLCILFLPIAALFGFRGPQLIAILIMLGSPTTVSSYVMATNMGHEGDLTSAAVMLSTVGSAFTLTLWIWILKSTGLL